MVEHTTSMLTLSSTAASAPSRIVIVTGGNTGIGYQTVLKLIKTPGIAKVYIASRNEVKVAAAIEKLKSEAGEGHTAALEFLKLDLSTVRGTKEAAEEFMRRENRLDVLVNNACLLNSPYTITPEGLVDTMQVDYLDQFVFTTALLPLLTKTSKEAGADVRIVMLASESHHMVPKSTVVKVDSLEGWNLSFDGTAMVPSSQIRYSFAKFFMMLFTNELQRRLNEENVDIIVAGVHPGGVMTDNIRELIRTRIPFGLRSVVSAITNLTLSHPSKGALNSYYLSTSPIPRQRPEEFKGGYFLPVGVKGKVDERVRYTPGGAVEENGKKLWKFTEEVVKTILEKGSATGL